MRPCWRPPPGRRRQSGAAPRVVDADDIAGADPPAEDGSRSGLLFWAALAALFIGWYGTNIFFNM